MRRSPPDLRYILSRVSPVCVFAVRVPSPASTMDGEAKKARGKGMSRAKRSRRPGSWDAAAKGGIPYAYIVGRIDAPSGSKVPEGPHRQGAGMIYAGRPTNRRVSI